MSVSKWAYEPDKCDGEPCVGDCDPCSKAREIMCDRKEDQQMPDTTITELINE